MQTKLDLEEIWKDIDGYEGYYQVSNLGRVKRLDNYIIGKGGYRKIQKGRIIAFSLKNNGYLMGCACLNGVQKTFTLHRLMAIAFIPNPSNLPLVNHINGIRTDNRLENLEWCTHSHNITEGFKYRSKRGINNHPLHKLTAKDVLDIRAKYIPRIYTMPMLSKEYGVKGDTIDNILKRKTWKWM